MTVEELVIQALARAALFTSEYPTTRSVLYRRVSVRQQQLYQLSGQVNQDWAGICATVPLSGGAADLKDILATHGGGSPVKFLAQLTKVEILDPGTSSFTAGDEVHVVPFLDAEDSALPPRAYVRNMVISGVGSDLDSVTSIEVYYVKQPLPITPTDGSVEIELPPPHDELLVIDLARFALKLAPKTDRIQEGIELLTVEEGDAIAQFTSYVKGFTNQESRFQGAPHTAGEV